MKIKDLIKILVEIQNKNGQDILVCLPDWQDTNMKNKIVGIEIELAKSHYDSFYPTARLNNGGYGGGNAFTEPYQNEIKAKEDIKIVVIKGEK